jgi:ATP-dependent exoDNAse (exonuclease V) alpha subunit
VLSDDGVDRACAYVALSRHKSDSHLYVSKSTLSPDKQIDDDQAIEILSQQYSKEQCATLAIERTSLNGQSLSDAGSYAYKHLEKESVSQEMSLA